MGVRGFSGAHHRNQGWTGMGMVSSFAGVGLRYRLRLSALGKSCRAGERLPWISSSPKALRQRRRNCTTRLRLIAPLVISLRKTAFPGARLATFVKPEGRPARKRPGALPSHSPHTTRKYGGERKRVASGHMCQLMHEAAKNPRLILHPQAEGARQECLLKTSEPG